MLIEIGRLFDIVVVVVVVVVVVAVVVFSGLIGHLNLWPLYRKVTLMQ